MEKKYTKRQVVYAKSRPSVKLVIRWHIDHIYYCHVLGDPKHREQVYFEQELTTNPGVHGYSYT